MSYSGEFKGFPPDAVAFLEGLAAHNNRQWFEAHRRQYEGALIAPARAFITDMGQMLAQMAPGIHADPRFNRSIFRVARDTRFAKDKTPYKQHLGLWFWEGAGPRMACPGFYLHLEPPRVMLGAGMYRFARDQLHPYRQAVVDPKLGPRLAEAATRLEAEGLRLDGARYKRTPRGFDGGHPNARWLLHDGLYAGLDEPLPPELHQPSFLDWCFERWARMLPLHLWLMEVKRLADSQARA